MSTGRVEMRTTTAAERFSVQIVSKPASPKTGLGRYVAELDRGLRARGIDVVHAPLQNPVPNALGTLAAKFGYDLETFFASYPLRTQARAGYPTHLTSQTLAGLLFTQRLPRPVVVTVHDILPYLLRHDDALDVYRTRAQRLVDTIAMRGLRRADRLIAVSRYTKSTLIDVLGIPEDRIDVVYQGVDSERFQPGAVPASLRLRHILPDDRRYLLFVGSEDPRKNLPLLLKAFARLREEMPDVVLLKVGTPAFEDQRRANIALCADLGILDAVRFIDDVDENELPSFYQLASVFAFPSRYEGFGFPVLEALACGTPVVALNTSSIPELAGDAARLVDDGSVEGFSAALRDTLREGAGDQQSRVSRAHAFTWSRTIERTLAAYRRAAASRAALGRSPVAAQTPLSRQVDE